MNNARFATCIHIMVLLTIKKNELLASDFIAGSININPVLVRKELTHLRMHGLIQSKEGKGGGSTLAKPADKILLADIYEAVKQVSLLGRFNSTNQSCPVGKKINQRIEAIYKGAEKALITQLKEISLADFCKSFS